MPILNPIHRQPEKIADLTDRFAIKNFVLSDTSLISSEHSLDDPFMFNGFVLTICLKGRAVFKLNFRDFAVSEGMIFAYLPGQIFRLMERSDDLVIETLFLSADYVLQLPLPKDLDLLKRLGSEPVQNVNPETLHNMLEFHALIAKYHRQPESGYRDGQTRALLFALLMEIGKVYSGAVPSVPRAVSRKDGLADEFFNLLLKHYKTERSVAFYADRLCLTAKYLSMTIKNVTGHPISDWINEAVIIESKRMLKTTDLTALQISEELNFPNPSFFGRFFKQYVGVTPLQYKNG